MSSAPPDNPARPKIRRYPLKDTLSLPRTAFPMKANLPQNEPSRLQDWQESRLYRADP